MDNSQFIKVNNYIIRLDSIQSFVLVGKNIFIHYTSEYTKNTLAVIEYLDEDSAKKEWELLV